MDLLKDILLVLIPSGLLLFGMFSLAQSFLQKQYEQKILDLKMKNTEIILPIRLQAYERIILLLERISPNNLLLRLSSNGTHVGDFQQILLSEIRSEFNHNLAQQVYISAEAWETVAAALNDTISTVNLAAIGLDPALPSIELSKKIFEIDINKDPKKIKEAIHQLKDEIQLVFN